jgi:1,4-dihydroxy-2-naphthoate polyprenyltransferase
MEDAGPTRASEQAAVDALEASRSAEMAFQTAPARRVGHLAGWAGAGRITTLLCALAPVVIASVVLWVQGQRISPGLLLATALAAMLLLAGANLLDTYLDHVRGVVLARRASSGGRPVGASTMHTGTRRGAAFHSVLLDADIYPLNALRVAALCFFASIVLGGPLALLGGHWAIALGVAGLAAAFLYSATSYALKRMPVGEIVVGAALGPGIVLFTIVVQHDRITPLALFTGAALGLFAAAILVAADLLAITPEVRDGRMTLVRRLGPRRAPWLFAICLLAAYAVVIWAALPASSPHGALAVLFSLPVAMLPLTGGLRGRNEATLSPVVRGTLFAYMAFAFWLVVGLLLGDLFLRLLSVLGA